MDKTRPDIAGSQQLVDVFGYWPSFHDAEVMRFSLDRSGSGEMPGPTAEAVIHVFEMTPEVGPGGTYVLKNHSLVTLRFYAVVELEVQGFGEQNALWGLQIINIAERQLERVRFDIQFQGSYGMDAGFQCYSVEVLSVEPYGEEGASPPIPGPYPG